jgi:methionyl-tRNA formyltransferase
LKNLSVGLGAPDPQVGEPTYASKITPDELRLDFERAAEFCSRVVRVGRAWTTWRGKRLIVHRSRVLGEEQELSPGQIQGNRVGTAEGALELLVVQPEGKPPMDGAAWVRGARPQPGERMGEWNGPR